MPLTAAEAKLRLAELHISRPDSPIGFWDQIKSTLGIEEGYFYTAESKIEVAKRLSQLDQSALDAGLTAIAGALKPVVEFGLKANLDLPYQTCYERMPFRTRSLQDGLHLGRGRVVLTAALHAYHYDQPIEWFAEWCAYLDLNAYDSDLDLLLALAIDAGNEKVLDVLVQSMEGRHPIGSVSKHGIRALLRCNHPGAWNVVEKLLLSADRQEGLRQAIVECADELNPEKFRRLLRLIVEHDLFRFSSVLRAFSVWLPELVAEKQPGNPAKVIVRLLEFLDDPDLQPDATFSDTFLRLWADAYFEADNAIGRGRQLFVSPEVEVRRAVAAVACSVRLASAFPLLQFALQDEDVRVCVYPMRYIRRTRLAYKETYSQVFHDLVLSVAKRWPVTKCEGIDVDRKLAWDIALYVAKPTDLPIYFDNLHELSPEGRFALAYDLDKVADAKLRKVMTLRFVADGSSEVRSAAFIALAKTEIIGEDAVELESLLSRKSGDMRTAVLSALSKQSDEMILASVARLSSAKDANQKAAGDELIQHLLKKAVDGVTEVATNSPPASQTSEDDPRTVFGLVDPDDLIWGKKPAHIEGVELFTPGAIRLIVDLEAYIHGRRNELTETSRSWEREEKQIGSLTSSDVIYIGYNNRKPSDVEPEKTIPLVAEVRAWLEDRSKTIDLDLRDLCRARVISAFADHHSNNLEEDVVVKLPPHFPSLPQYLSCIKGCLAYLVRGWEVPISDLLDLFSNVIALRAENRYDYDEFLTEYVEKSWRKSSDLGLLLQLLHEQANNPKAGFTQTDWERFYRLLRYIDEPTGRTGRDKVEQQQAECQANKPSYSTAYSMRNKRRIIEVPRRRQVPLDILDRCFVAGACTEADVLDQLRLDIHYITWNCREFSPQIRKVAQKLVDRIIQIESQRGDMASQASDLASDIRGLVHLPQVIHILKTGVTLSRTGFGFSTNVSSRAKSLTRLLTYSRPALDETPEAAASAIKAIKAVPERLIEFALVSPYWAAAIEMVVGWDGLADAVWWLHGHTKDSEYYMPDELKELSAGAISERTPLTAEQLENGACDPAWFHRFRDKLDEKQWKLLDKCAKFASSGMGHARAQLYAKALSGTIAVHEIVENVKTKRNPNYVRALGLVPLQQDADADVRFRYGVIQEFLAGSRQFGSMRRETEKLASQIALDNLAATAGYPDSLRLTWSLEAAEVEDMKDGGISVTEGEVTVRLAFDSLGKAEISVEKVGKALKEIPAALKKLPTIKALTDRRTLLNKQVVRMRFALEQAMQRGDGFSLSELKGLLDHPGLQPLLRNLVFVGESGCADFPGEGSKLESETGMLHIAHPYDLLKRGDWPQWQRRIFLEERIQPFKQVFRELYTLTPAEQDQDKLTRYGGHQVRPAQTIAILQKRGWIARYQEGVSKTNHNLGITVWLTAEEADFTPGDIEGVTLEGLYFTKTNDYKAIPLKEIPPVFFSETVRDLDLVVSVASMVGIDPEASESTVEMRQNVVNQTAQLLGLVNVDFAPRHVVIAGKLAEYTVHLGSGVVHQRAKGELVIMAVRQPQRGRIFLPFVDDDPRTAEIVSKVILLARDDEIKDPTILGQIVG